MARVSMPSSTPSLEGKPLKLEGKPLKHPLWSFPHTPTKSKTIKRKM